MTRNSLDLILNSNHCIMIWDNSQSYFKLNRTKLRVEALRKYTWKVTWCRTWITWPYLVTQNNKKHWGFGVTAHTTNHYRDKMKWLFCFLVCPVLGHMMGGQMMGEQMMDGQMMGRQMMGGWTEKNVNDDSVQRMAQFSLSAIDGMRNSLYRSRVVEVTHAETQVNYS